MFLSLIVTFVILLSGALSADESISPPSEIAETAEPTVTISLKDGKSYSGRLLADYRQENGAGLTALEMRDGAIEVIHSEQIAEMRSTGEAFRPMTLDEAGRSLLDDLGKDTTFIKPSISLSRTIRRQVTRSGAENSSNRSIVRSPSIRIDAVSNWKNRNSP